MSFSSSSSSSSSNVEGNVEKKKEEYEAQQHTIVVVVVATIVDSSAANAAAAERNIPTSFIPTHTHTPSSSPLLSIHCFFENAVSNASLFIFRPRLNLWNSIAAAAASAADQLSNVQIVEACCSLPLHHLHLLLLLLLLNGLLHAVESFFKVHTQRQDENFKQTRHSTDGFILSSHCVGHTHRQTIVTVVL